MLDKGNVFLAAIVFTAFYYKVTGEKLLEVGRHDVDDIVNYKYDGCRDQAIEKFIHSGLLKQELQGSKKFRDAWNATTECPKMIPKGIKEHTTALMTYAQGGNFMKTFNSEVETLGGNVSTYEENFKFKSFHFLLMDAIMLLNPKECKTLHLFSENSYSHMKNGSKVRFAGFTTVHLSYSSIKADNDMDGFVLFNITSCFFANLGSNICKSDDDEILLSPAELFTVEKIKQITDQDDAEYTEIVLKHSKVDGSPNCHIFSRSSADVSTRWPVMAFVALSLFFSLTVE